MDNPETLATLGTQDTNQAKTTTQIFMIEHHYLYIYAMHPNQ